MYSLVLYGLLTINAGSNILVLLFLHTFIFLGEYLVFHCFETITILFVTLTSVVMYLLIFCSEFVPVLTLTIFLSNACPNHALPPALFSSENPESFPILTSSFVWYRKTDGAVFDRNLFLFLNLLVLHDPVLYYCQSIQQLISSTWRLCFCVCVLQLTFMFIVPNHILAWLCRV